MERRLEDEAAVARWLAGRGGARIVGTLVEQRRMVLPALQAAYAQLQALAADHGWAGLDTYNAEGPDSGLLCILVRPPEHLYLYLAVHGPGAHARRAGAFERALHKLSTVEVLTCTVDDMAQITARLSRPR